MKGRDSGMPDEELWSSFFDAPAALAALWGAGRLRGDIVEFGCGYGTFTLPAAQCTDGIVTAFDIEPEMVEYVRKKAAASQLFNIRAELRDFVGNGTGLADGSQRYAMIFNLLHLEHPVQLLREALRTLEPGGTLAVIHWRSDIATPRGPSLSIRPKPAQCAAWMEEAGFAAPTHVDLQRSCPYHFGLVARRPITDGVADEHPDRVQP
jgi:SAM-dependent methyltransferase